MLHSKIFFPPIPFSAFALNVSDPSLPSPPASDGKILVKNSRYYGTIGPCHILVCPVN